MTEAGDDERKMRYGYVYLGNACLLISRVESSQEDDCKGYYKFHAKQLHFTSLSPRRKELSGYHEGICRAEILDTGVITVGTSS